MQKVKMLIEAITKHNQEKGFQHSYKVKNESATRASILCITCAANNGFNVGVIASNE